MCFKFLVSTLAVALLSSSAFAQSSMERELQEQKRKSEAAQSRDRDRQQANGAAVQVDLKAGLKFECDNKTYYYWFLRGVAYEGYRDFTFSKLETNLRLGSTDKFEFGRYTWDGSILSFKINRQTLELNARDGTLYTKYPEGQITKTKCNFAGGDINNFDKRR